MPRNREEADLFFCSVTPLQNVRNENLVLRRWVKTPIARKWLSFAGILIHKPSSNRNSQKRLKFLKNNDLCNRQLSDMAL